MDGISFSKSSALCIAWNSIDLVAGGSVGGIGLFRPVKRYRNWFLVEYESRFLIHSNNVRLQSTDCIMNMSHNFGVALHQTLSFQAQFKSEALFVNNTIAVDLTATDEECSVLGLGGQQDVQFASIDHTTLVIGDNLVMLHVRATTAAGKAVGIGVVGGQTTTLGLNTNLNSTISLVKNVVTIASDKGDVEGFAFVRCRLQRGAGLSFQHNVITITSKMDSFVFLAGMMFASNVLSSVVDVVDSTMLFSNNTISLYSRSTSDAVVVGITFGSWSPSTNTNYSGRVGLKKAALIFAGSSIAISTSTRRTDPNFRTFGIGLLGNLTYMYADRESHTLLVFANNAVTIKGATTGLFGDASLALYTFDALGFKSVNPPAVLFRCNTYGAESIDFLHDATQLVPLFAPFLRSSPGKFGQVACATCLTSAECSPLHPTVLSANGTEFTENRHGECQCRCAAAETQESQLGPMLTCPFAVSSLSQCQKHIVVTTPQPTAAATPQPQPPPPPLPLPTPTIIDVPFRAGTSTTTQSQPLRPPTHTKSEHQDCTTSPSMSPSQRRDVPLPLTPSFTLIKSLSPTIDGRPHTRTASTVETIPPPTTFPTEAPTPTPTTHVALSKAAAEAVEQARPQKTVATATTVPIAAVSAVSGAGAGGSAQDLQALMILGSMSCAGPATKEVASGGKNSVVPFAIVEGPAGPLLSNLALVAIVMIIQMVTVFFYAKAKKHTLVASCAKLRFPSWSNTAFVLLYQGTIHSACNILFTSDTSLRSKIFGWIGIIVCVAAPLVGPILLLRGVWVVRYIKYRHVFTSIPHWIRTIFLPSGFYDSSKGADIHRIVPRYNSFFSSLRKGVPPLVLLLPFFKAILVALMATVPSVDCMVRFGVIGAAHCLMAFGIALLRPYRVALNNIFGVAMNAATAAMCFASVSDDLGTNVTYIMTVCTVIGTLSTILGIAIKLFEFLKWKKQERRLREHDPLGVGEDDQEMSSDEDSDDEGGDEDIDFDDDGGTAALAVPLRDSKHNINEDDEGVQLHNPLHAETENQ